MGDMLRSRGIPTRLVNGFGPGTFENTINSFVVRSEDAHTWVEVYFPKYGWIQFEPTHDNVYTPIPRGLSGGADAGFPRPGGATPRARGSRPPAGPHPPPG